MAGIQIFKIVKIILIATFLFVKDNNRNQMSRYRAIPFSAGRVAREGSRSTFPSKFGLLPSLKTAYSQVDDPLVPFTKGINQVYLRNLVLAVFVLATAAFSQTSNGVTDWFFQVGYAANLAAGETYIDIVYDGANGAPLLGPGFAGANTGDICVSVYAIDPSEELDSWCSCLLSPDQVVHLGAVADLISNTANGVKPSSLTIKLIGSAPLGPGVTGSATAAFCSTQAANINMAEVTAGMAAWGTTLHPAPGSTTAFVSTETPFTASSLSGAELASLTGRCASIIGNLSGAGICSSCHTGALGALNK